MTDSHWSKYLANGISVPPGGMHKSSLVKVLIDFFQRRFLSGKTFVTFPMSRHIFTSKVSKIFKMLTQTIHCLIIRSLVSHQRIKITNLTSKVSTDVHSRHGRWSGRIKSQMKISSREETKTQVSAITLRSCFSPGTALI